jgi:hypothetical protein
MTGWPGGLTCVTSGGLTIAGNLTLGSANTSTAVNAGTGTITFSATGTGKTLTFNGKSITATTLAFSGTGGGWTFQDTFSSTAGITHTAGTVDFGTQSGSLNFLASTGATARVLTLGSGTITLTGTGSGAGLTPINVIQGGLTLNSGTSTLKVNTSNASNQTIAGGTKTFYNLWLTGTTGNVTTITSDNSYNDIRIDNTQARTVQFEQSTTHTAASITWSGLAGNLLTIKSDTNGSQWFLVAPLSSSPYLSLKDSYVTGGVQNASDSTDAGHNLNWNFTSTTSANMKVRGFFLMANQPIGSSLTA